MTNEIQKEGLETAVDRLFNGIGHAGGLIDSHNLDEQPGVAEKIGPIADMAVALSSALDELCVKPAGSSFWQLRGVSDDLADMIETHDLPERSKSLAIGIKRAVDWIASGLEDEESETAGAANAAGNGADAEPVASGDDEHLGKADKHTENAHDHVEDVHCMVETLVKALDDDQAPAIRVLLVIKESLRNAWNELDYVEIEHSRLKGGVAA